MKPWLLGNTTVRSPFRLKEGLIALSTSDLQGNLHGQLQEINFIKLLDEHGIVDLREDKKDKTYSIGRKWRSALNKLGFLYSEKATIGQVDMITPNGWRLIRSEAVPAMQECFLRALGALCIPSPIEDDFCFARFSPLHHVLRIMLELKKKSKDSCINFIEMACIIQFTNSENSIPTIVSQIFDLRNRRSSAENKKKFDQQERSATAKKYNYKETTFNDYADTNFRYLKATGLVQSKGRGITFVPEKQLFIEKLLQQHKITSSDDEYFTTLYNGVPLPTDDKESALIILKDLLQQLKEKGISFNVHERSLNNPADIAIVRHDIEALLSEKKEEEYAARQAAEWEEIAEYMHLIINRGVRKSDQGKEIKIPTSEAPAYFEWVVWRAFLAINNLLNKPYEARRFKIDQDFLPVATAPGNGPDLIFEFKNFVLVVEVTLTSNSRQEAVEGESVRRHIADLMIDYDRRLKKPVYGLFLANRIDSNTAETFRIGSWYTSNDQKMKLEIIPLTLTSFKIFFETLFTVKRIDIDIIFNLLDKCGKLKHQHEAPEWKREIEQIVSQSIQNLKEF